MPRRQLSLIRESLLPKGWRDALRQLLLFAAANRECLAIGTEAHRIHAIGKRSTRFVVAEDALQNPVRRRTSAGHGAACATGEEAAVWIRGGGRGGIGVQSQMQKKLFAEAHRDPAS